MGNQVYPSLQIDLLMQQFLYYRMAIVSHRFFIVNGNHKGIPIARRFHDREFISAKKYCASPVRKKSYQLASVFS